MRTKTARAWWIGAVGALVIAAAATLAAGCGGSSGATAAPSASPTLSPGPGSRSTYADPDWGIAFQVAPGFVQKGPRSVAGSAVSGTTFSRVSGTDLHWTGLVMVGAADEPGAAAINGQGLAALLNQRLGQPGSAVRVEGPALATTVGPSWPAATVFYSMKLPKGFPARVVGRRARVEEVAFVAAGRLFEFSLLSVPGVAWRAHRAELELPVKTLRSL
jgi:hypothetical protein